MACAVGQAPRHATPQPSVRVTDEHSCGYAYATGWVAAAYLQPVRHVGATVRLTRTPRCRVARALDLGTPAAEDETPTDMGTTGHYPVGFVASHEVPDEVAIHRPTSPWEDDSEARR